MIFWERIRSILFRRLQTRREAIEAGGYAVIPLSVIKELPEAEQKPVRRILRDLDAIAKRKWPGIWFQPIIRESNGTFKEHPRQEPPDNTLF